MVFTKIGESKGKFGLWEDALLRDIIEEREQCVSEEYFKLFGQLQMNVRDTILYWKF